MLSRDDLGIGPGRSALESLDDTRARFNLKTNAVEIDIAAAAIAPIMGHIGTPASVEVGVAD